MLTIEDVESRTYDLDYKSRDLYLSPRENFPKTFEQNISLFKNEVFHRLFKDSKYDRDLLLMIEINEFLHNSLHNQTFRDFLETSESLVDKCNNLFYKFYSQKSFQIYRIFEKARRNNIVLNAVLLPWHSHPEVEKIKELYLDLNAEQFYYFFCNFAENEGAKSNLKYDLVDFKLHEIYIKFIKKEVRIGSKELFSSFLFSELMVNLDDLIDYSNSYLLQDSTLEDLVEDFIINLSGELIPNRILLTLIINDEDFKKMSLIDKYVLLATLSISNLAFNSNVDLDDMPLNYILNSVLEEKITVSDLVGFFKRYTDDREIRKMNISSYQDIDLIKDGTQPFIWIKEMVTESIDKRIDLDKYSRFYDNACHIKDNKDD